MTKFPMKLTTSVLALSIALSSAITGTYATAGVITTVATKFKDVAPTYWAAAAIELAVSQGYFKGYADGTFKPNSPITKAEIAAILSRIATQPDVSASRPDFTDIPTWAVDGVNGAVKKGFINPANYNGKLNATTPITRGELAIWLTNGLASTNTDFGVALKDVTNTVVPAKEYFTNKLPAAQKNAVAVALGIGLMTVGPDKMFGTDRTTTRAEAAALIARYIVVSNKNPDSFQGLQELRAVGLTGTNVRIIAPKVVKVPAERIPGYDYSKVTDDFSQVRNKELKTVTNYADVKIKNWIIVNPYIKGDKRSIYYPVFLDEGDTLLHGAYYSFTEYDMDLKGNMNQLQVGSHFNSAVFSPALSPKSKSSTNYEVPKINDITGPRGVFLVNKAHYWGTGLLHLASGFGEKITLDAKDGQIYMVVPY